MNNDLGIEIGIEVVKAALHKEAFDVTLETILEDEEDFLSFILRVKARDYVIEDTTYTHGNGVPFTIKMDRDTPDVKYWLMLGEDEDVEFKITPGTLYACLFFAEMREKEPEELENF